MTPYLPPGFQFNPYPIELVICYLLKKVLGEQLPWDAVIEGEVYGDDAQLPGADDIGDREMHMFVKNKKNQNGTKTKRMTKNGHWKVTGNKKLIKDKRGNHIGTMRSLVLVETNKSGRKRKLLMDEYILDGSLKNVINSEGWVLCKIKQSNRSPERPCSQEEEEEGDGLTSRPTASPALQGIDNMSSVDTDDFWPSMEDNQAMAECSLEPAGGPSHMWSDQLFDQSMMGTPTLTPTEPQTLGGIDYNWVNYNGCSNMNNGNLFNEAECSLEPAAGPSHMWSDQLFDQSMMGTPTPTPTEPQTLGGIYYNWVNHDGCSNMNNENLFHEAECSLEPAVGPRHPWSDQFFDQSMMGTPLLETLGGNDYNGLNHDGWANMNNENLFNEFLDYIYYPESQT